MTEERLASVESFTLIERRVDHADSVELLQAFYRDQVARYGVAESVDLDPRMYASPSGTFVVAYADGRPVGCAGCRWYDQQRNVVEIKKAFLVPQVRGHGLGRALLGWLEDWASEHGARQAILETGVRNTAAIALFTGSGYQPVPPYVAGRDPAINRPFRKRLTTRQATRAAATAGSAIAR